MRQKLNTLFKYSALAILIVFGFITIIGTGGDDDKKSAHTSNIEGTWNVKYTYNDQPADYGPYVFEFTQDGNKVTLVSGEIQLDTSGPVFDLIEGQGTINGYEVEFTAWNEAENLDVVFTGLFSNLDTIISIDSVDSGDDISWSATWGENESAVGRWRAVKCTT